MLHTWGRSSSIGKSDGFASGSSAQPLVFAGDRSNSSLLAFNNSLHQHFPPSLGACQLTDSSPAASSSNLQMPQEPPRHSGMLPFAGQIGGASSSGAAAGLAGPDRDLAELCAYESGVVAVPASLLAAARQRRKSQLALLSTLVEDEESARAAELISAQNSTAGRSSKGGRGSSSSGQLAPLSIISMAELGQALGSFHSSSPRVSERLLRMQQASRLSSSQDVGTASSAPGSQQQAVSSSNAEQGMGTNMASAGTGSQMASSREGGGTARGSVSSLHPSSYDAELRGGGASSQRLSSQGRDSYEGGTGRGSVYSGRSLAQSYATGTGTGGSSTRLPLLPTAPVSTESALGMSVHLTPTAPAHVRHATPAASAAGAEAAAGAAGLASAPPESSASQIAAPSASQAAALLRLEGSQSLALEGRRRLGADLEEARSSKTSVLGWLRDKTEASALAAPLGLGVAAASAAAAVGGLGVPSTMRRAKYVSHSKSSKVRIPGRGDGVMCTISSPCTACHASPPACSSCEAYISISPQYHTPTPVWCRWCCACVAPLRAPSWK